MKRWGSWSTRKECMKLYGELKTYTVEYTPKRRQLPLELCLVIHELEQRACGFCIVWRRGGCRRARGHDGGVVEVVHAEAHTRNYRSKRLLLTP